MQFTSMVYLGFFAAVFFVYWALPHRFRWALCLAASLLFYALLGLPALCVLLCCIGISYGMGLLLAQKKGRAWLVVCVAAALFPLLLFKYFDSLAALAGGRTSVSLLMPVGISFFTFKIIAYLVEVWRGTLPAQQHFGKYALYVSFFPEVSSGPIQRPDDLLLQLEVPRVFDKTQAIQGAQLALWGFFKKLMLADNLAYYVHTGFTSHMQIIGPSIILAAVLYSLQLYFDFSGYSDIAIGCMKLLGFTVPDNFKSPYFSKSIREFWARWHISLSSFLRDYVYFPLGGSRRGTVRTCVNLLLTFLISGLWHGTGLQFVAWGLLHGAYQVAGRLTQGLRHRAWTLSHLCEDGRFACAVKMLCTFSLVTVAWVFFGADSLSHALILFRRMTDSFSLSPQTWKNALVMLELNGTMLLRLGAAGLLAFVADFKAREIGFTAWLSARKKWVQAALCYAMLLFIAFFAPVGGGSFIYFKF
ncbi:MAG: MBOAT family O-acyltransferase [Ruthenibacterium sp.]